MQKQEENLDKRTSFEVWVGSYGLNCYVARSGAVAAEYVY